MEAEGPTLIQKEEMLEDLKVVQVIKQMVHQGKEVNRMQAVAVPQVGALELVDMTLPLMVVVAVVAGMVADMA